MRLLLCALALALAGCASGVLIDEQASAIRRGDLAAAERFGDQAIREGVQLEKAWYNQGIVYWRQGKREPSIRAYTMAARYGSTAAQQALVSMGATVPPADLPGQSNSSVAADMADSFNRGYQGGSVTCTTFGFPDMKRVNCR